MQKPATRALPAKKRLILQLIIGLVTLVSSVVTPSQTHATAIGDNQAIESRQTNPYALLHVSSSSSASLINVSATTVPEPAKEGKMADATITDDQQKKSDETILYQSPDMIEGIVKDYFKDIPLMATIAKCESHYQQTYKNGDIYRGKVNTSDVGVLQINEKYHLKTAESMGIDIYTLDGNMAYARYLYEKEGSAPWNSSGACWDSAETTARVTSKTTES